jgi:hypothetical protein
VEREKKLTPVLRAAAALRDAAACLRADRSRVLAGCFRGSAERVAVWRQPGRAAPLAAWIGPAGGLSPARRLQAAQAFRRGRQ